jgi:hypothetical protein
MWLLLWAGLLLAVMVAAWVLWEAALGVITIARWVAHWWVIGGGRALVLTALAVAVVAAVTWWRELLPPADESDKPGEEDAPIKADVIRLDKLPVLTG